MLSRRSLLTSSIGAALAAPHVATTVFAQETWPTRVVHSISMSPAGTGGDNLVRFYARKLQEMTGSTVVVENKVGAVGNIASEYVARSKPDGYTIYMAPANFLAIAPHVFTKLAYHPVNDFEHITTLFRIPFILVVAGDSPFKTVADLTAHLKKQGGNGSYGSLSTFSLVAAELYKQQFGLNTVDVKYKEPQAALADLIGGNVSFVYVDPTSGAAQINSGKVRPLAVTTKNRVEALKHIPSAGEAGINSDLYAWWAVHAPKGTPKPIQDRIEKLFNDITAAPDTRQFLANGGCDPLPGNAKLARDMIEQGVKQWGEYVKIAKIEPLS